MGFFSAIKDTKVALDLRNAAQDINSYQRAMIEIFNQYGNNSQLSDMDRILVRGYLQRIEDKTIYMKRRMEDLEPEHLFLTMVPCMDGHLTAVPGYVMAMFEMVHTMRSDLL